MKPSRQLKEALSWRLVAELWRRYPNRYALIETHPGGSQYDCLSLLEYRDGFHSILDVNRAGSLHVHRGRTPRSWSDWTDRLLADPRGFLDQIGEAIGTARPNSLPASTSTTLTFRFISEFLTHSIGRLEEWECRNGFPDTSGDGGGRRDAYFDRFPTIATVAPPQVPVTGRLDPAYLYWFIIRNGEPLICLDTDGRLYRTSGELYDLKASYRASRRVWPMITAAVLDLLP